MGSALLVATALTPGDLAARMEETGGWDVAVLDPHGADPGGAEPGDGEDPGAAADAVAAAPWTARARVTAYCLTGRMRSGRAVYAGAIATDRSVIPAGSRVEIDGFPGRVFTSEDTGSGVRGWHLDVWMASCTDARRWGNQTRAIRVVRWGW